MMMEESADAHGQSRGWKELFGRLMIRSSHFAVDGTNGIILLPDEAGRTTWTWLVQQCTPRMYPVVPWQSYVSHGREYRSKHQSEVYHTSKLEL
jgi:hypothetical protein